METSQHLSQIYQQLQRAQERVTTIQIQVKDREIKDQLTLLSRQVGDMCWAIDRIIELQPLVEKFEGVDATQRKMSLDGTLILWSKDQQHQ
jgi:hypothetical protein